MSHSIDKLDLKILQMISQNARTPFLEVARECNVSGAAIHQRVQKMMDNGVIKGSEFIIDVSRIGYQTCAFVGVTIQNLTHYNDVVEALQQIPEIVECHSITGRYTLLLKIYARDNHHLMSIIMDKIGVLPGVTNTETCFISLDEVFVRQVASFK
jgi:Lrp/AsnC family transcriptional regulator, regulator for asnA, asnC and gidA